MLSKEFEVAFMIELLYCTLYQISHPVIGNSSLGTVVACQDTQKITLHVTASHTGAFMQRQKIFPKGWGRGVCSEVRQFVTAH